MRFLLTLVAVSSLTLATLAAEPCVSGTPVGKRPGPYSFLVATGPQRGQQTCYICEQHDGDKPAVVVFARNTTDSLGKLMSKIDAVAIAKKDTGCKAWLTILADKADLDSLAKWTQKQGIKSSPVGVFEDADGPPSYKLHKDAEVTVLIFTKQKVTANFAFRAGELDDKAMDSVLKAMSQTLDVK